MDDLSHIHPLLIEYSLENTNVLSECVCVCVCVLVRRRGKDEWGREREMGIGHGDTVHKFHFTSTHSMIYADHELSKKFTDTLFQLNTVKEHDNHEVI